MHDSNQISRDAQNRRSAPRKKVDLFINRFIDGYPYLCQALDVSPTGMRLRPIHEPHLHDGEAGSSKRFMGLQFMLPGIDEVLTASGEAVFQGERGELGVRFTALGAEQRAAIASFVAAHAA